MGKQIQNNTKVLMVGSCLSVRGGMTTVVESFLRHNFGNNIILKYIPTHVEGKTNVYKTLFFFKALVRIIFLIVFGNVSIVHMHMSERGSFKRKYIVYKIAQQFNKKVILHTHGAEFKEFFESSTSNLKAKIKKLLRESNVVITLGESWDQIIKQIEPEANTFILRNSVEIPDRENKINNENIKVLFLAVLIKRKGILDLIEASPKIIRELKKYNKQIEFIIAGDGKLSKESKSLAEKLGVNSYFKFVGWVNNEQKQELLKTTDLFILPSYNEGLPLSILEAISYGIPIISTNVGSINEAVKSGENGFLIYPGNIEMLANNTIELLLSSDFHNAGKKSREIAESFFNINKYFEEIESLYVKLKSN